MKRITLPLIPAIGGCCGTSAITSVFLCPVWLFSGLFPSFTTVVLVSLCVLSEFSLSDNVCTLLICICFLGLKYYCFFLNCKLHCCGIPPHGSSKFTYCFVLSRHYVCNSPDCFSWFFRFGNVVHYFFALFLMCLAGCVG